MHTSIGADSLDTAHQRKSDVSLATLGISLHADHLGSTTASGALLARQTYYAYGAPRTSDGTLPTDYTFTGQRADTSAGLMYYGARYYDAGLGRFTQPDTIVPDWYNPQLLNRFAYVRNNPINLTDPSGHCDPDYCKWVPDENGRLIIRPKEPEPKPPIGESGCGIYECPQPDDPIPVIVTDPNGLAYIAFISPAHFLLSSSSAAGMLPAPTNPSIGQPIYRIAGGESGFRGQSWTSFDPKYLANSAEAFGLPRTNTRNILIQGTIMDPTGMRVQPSVPIPPNQGGATEIIVPNAPTQIRIDRITIRTTYIEIVLIPRYGGGDAWLRFWDYFR